MPDIYISSEEELTHYGVKGMKWGRRNPRNKDYSDTQANRDAQIYGKRGVRRINKSLNDGDGVATARSYEKTRRDRVMSKNKYVRQGGKIAGTILGLAAPTAIDYGFQVVADTRGPIGNLARGIERSPIGSLAISTLRNPAVLATVSAGAAAMGNMLAGDMAVALNMRFHGYDPDRR